MTQEELDQVLKLHKKWLDGDSAGRRAFFFNSYSAAMCTCMADSGTPRDKNATDEHCATYKKRKKEALPW